MDFSTVVKKSYDKDNLKMKAIDWGLIMAGSVAADQHTWCQDSSWEITSHLIYRQEAKRGYLGVSWALKPQSLPLVSDLLQQTTPPNPFQIIPPTGNQAGKYMSLWRQYSFKSPYWVSHEEQYSKQHSSVVSALISMSSLLPWVPVLTSLCLRMLPKSVGWKKPFLPQVT